MSSNSDIAIKVDNVSKTFKLPHEKSSSLKSAFLNKVKQKKGYELQEALKDVSFEVKKGEFFGIVGRNGSGKSTLLKCMAGVYTPNKGKIHINGKLVPFIELGVGFNPELSGRDNVFLNGALLGFSRKQMEAMYDEIVEFAELEPFMDQKLKNYSSGMQVRLAFSIAIRAKGDVLLLDEVLAVGDTAFQRKCYDYFYQLKEQGQTVILVSHNMIAIEQFCTRAALLSKGELVDIGEPGDITRKYSDLNIVTQSEDSDSKKRPAKREEGDVSIKTHIEVNGVPSGAIRAVNKKLNIICDIQSKVDISNGVLSVIILNTANTPIFAANSRVASQTINLEKNKKMTVLVEVDNIFSNGEYKVAIALKDFEQTEVYFSSMNAAKFVSGGRLHEYAITSPDYRMAIEN